MRGQRLLIATLGAAIIITCCSSIDPSSTDTGRTISKGTKRNFKERLTEMAKEFGATSFEDTSEEMASVEEKGKPLAPKQHVKRLISAEQNAEFQEYQGVMGRPGLDFPVLPSIPKTGFSCREVKSSGYYADLDTDCQVFHICADGRKISFLCPNGTIFRQSHLICDWWWTVDCASSKEHYEESAELLANDQKIYRARSDALSKARARQHVNRKPGIIRDFEGARASVTSYSTEPVQHNARIQVHSKVINPRKQLPNSTPNPGFLRSSEEFQAGSSMEQAEQRPIHAFQPPSLESRPRRPQYLGSQQNRHFEKNDQPDKVERFPQNVPLAPRASKPQQISQFKEFSENQPPLEVSPRPQQLPVTTRRPKIGQFSHNGQFEQGLPDQYKSLARITHNHQQPRQRSQQEPQFRPEPQILSQSKERSNGTRTYNHIRFFPPSEIEGQLPAETGSFINSRGNHLNGIQHTTDRQKTSQNIVQEVTSKSYVELNRSQTTALETLSQMKSVVPQVTDRGITGLSNIQSSSEAITEGHVFDDSDGFQEPQSEEQYKNEDLFHLHGNSKQSDINADVVFTESSVKHSNSDSSVFGADLKDEPGEIDLIEDLGLSKPPTDIQFKGKDWHGGYENSELQDYVQPTESLHLLDISKATTNLSAKEYASDAISADPSQGFFTGKTHRFRTSTTALTSMTSEPRTVQNMVNSTPKPPGEEMLSIKITSKPHTIISDIHDSESTEPPKELTGNYAIGTRQPVRSWPTSTPISSTSAPTKVSFINEKPIAKKLEPIFVEIIHRGSSEPPVLKTYTVEELEKRSGATRSPISTDEDSLSSSNPEMSTTLTVPPSLVTSSRRVRPRKKLISLTPVPDVTPDQLTTPIPPTTLRVTFSRNLQPPELTMTSSNPYSKNKMKSDDAPQNLSTFRTRSKPPYTEHTTPVSPVTLSRRVQPPFESLIQFNSGSSIPASASVVEQDRQQHKIDTANREATTSFQAVTNGRFPNIGSHRLPQETNFAQNIMVSTERSAATVRIISEPTKNSTVYVEAQHQTTSEPSPVTNLRQRLLSKKQKTMTELVENTTPFLNTSLELGILITEPTAGPDIPLSLALKQEPTSSPQYRMRDGLAIPASSGPSTLHSLAVYFATQGRNEETTTHTLTGFDFKKHKEKGEEPTTESIPVASPTIQYGSATEGNETDTSVVAPGFLTKSTRDSYSELFPNTNEDQSSAVQEQVRSMAMTTEKYDIEFKTMDLKTTHSSHSELRNELLDKLAEISEMELKTSSEKAIASSQREVSHSDTEDLLQGTDSRDLRELAQIFSHALSAYLENPEEFKKVLTEIRPKDPSSISTDDAKQFEANQLQSATIGSVSRSTSVPLTTSSTEYSSVTQEDEEVLDFSDVSKVSRRKSKTTTLMPPYSKYVRTEKLKDLVSTSYVNSAAMVTSRNNGVTQTTSKSSSTEALENVDLKPPEEGLQNAQSTYYIFPNQQAPANTVTVSSEVLENPQAAEELGEDYTLPPGTKQYHGPGYGPQVGEVKFAPTAGGVNDASRPRYGGFQNNSRVTPKEASSKYTSVPDIKYHTRSTENPISATQGVETALTMKVHAEIGNILNTFVPQELNNLAVGGIPQTSVENIQKEHIQPQNLMTHSKQAVLGSSTTAFTPLRASQPSDALNLERTWSSMGNIVDALTINRELSESDIEGRTSSTTVQEIISSVATTQKPATSTKSVFKTRHRLSSVSDISKPTVTVVDGEDPTLILPDTHSASSSGGISTKSSSAQENGHSQLGIETESADSHEHSSDRPNPKEEVQPLDISHVTFYSEKIKPLPPSSASLIREPISRKNRVEALISSSTSSYIPENASVPNENSEEMSVKTSLKYTPFRNEPTSTTQTHSSTMASKSSTTPRNTAMKNGFFPIQQRSGSYQEPHMLGQGLIKNETLRGASEMSLSSRQYVSAPFTETPFPAETTIASWKQEIQQSEQDVYNVNLQPIQSSMRLPITSSIPRSRGASPSRRAKNTTITPPPFNGGINVEFLEDDHFVVPNTSMSMLALLASRGSVTFSPDNNTLSRGKKFPEKQKSLKMEFLPTELNNTSNSQQSVRIRTMISSAESSNSSTSPNVSTFSKIFSSNRSLTSMSRTSLQTDLKMDNGTTDQLQALENLQKILFSANSTIADDGSMYGNLNESSSLSLINEMKQAVTNSTVRRLVLLLVNSFMENTPKETQLQLINALLRMPVDHRVSEAQQDSVSALLKESVEFLSEKSSGRDTATTVSGCKSHPSSVLETSSQTSLITQPNFESKHLTMTEVPATKFRTRGRKNPQAATPQVHPTTTAVHSKGRRLVRVRVITESPQTVPSITSSTEEISQPEEGASLPQSDTRAVELLRSLYSLASRWG